MKAKQENDYSSDILAPKENPDFIGHDAAQNELLLTKKLQKMPNAWFFSGPKGTGKATLAYRFARLLLSNGDNMQLDKSHPVFCKIKSGSHSDLIVIDKETSVGSGKEIVVDDTRKVGSFLRLTSSETGYRIVIIDSIDHLNVNAANSILKLLEEPTKNSLFIIISHLPGRVLPTIKSRCRQLKFCRLRDDQVSQILQNIIPIIGLRELDGLTKISDGSPGRAIDIMKAGGLDFYESIIEILDGDNFQLKNKFASKLALKDNAEAWEIVRYIIVWTINNVVKGSINKGKLLIISGKEKAVAERLLSRNSVSDLLDKSQKIESLMSKTAGLNLDHRSVILNILEMLEK